MMCSDEGAVELSTLLRNNPAGHSNAAWHGKHAALDCAQCVV